MQRITRAIEIKNEEKHKRNDKNKTLQAAVGKTPKQNMQKNEIAG